MSATDRLQLASLGLHPDRMRRLLSAWGNHRAVLRAIELGQIDVSDSIRARLGIDAVEATRRAGATVMTWQELPSGLRELPDCPDLLFGRGASLPAASGVAIVGTRKATSYGRQTARRFGHAVGQAGWPVVSGLARGIDGAAHVGCLEAGGKAVAVLGCGVDVAYPPEHRPLADRIIAAGGSIVSEYPPGSPPDAWRFPPRNRIISGLSAVVVIVEAGVTGGALITAARGLEQGRLVLAVPGDIDRETSRGCNMLIRDGAHPVLDVEDLITSLTFVLGPPPGRPGSDDDPIVALLAANPMSVDEIAAEIGCTAGEALRHLTRLELAGEVMVESGQATLTRPGTL
jgi:DNA processing protein